MERRCPGAEKVRSFRHPHPPPARSLRQRRISASRPGQMVSRRIPPALGTRFILAQGRPADLARSATRRRRKETQPRHRAGRPAFRGLSGRAPRRRAPLCRPGIRRRLVLPLERTPAPRQCRSARKQTRSKVGTRRAWRRVFEQGLDKTIGWAMPLRREHYPDGTGAWASGAWFYRPERMYLVPGDSPMGYRLPLDSLPWAPASDRQWTEETDPWEFRPPLPTRQAMSGQRYVAGRRTPYDQQAWVEQLMEKEGTARPPSQRRAPARPRNGPGGRGVRPVDHPHGPLRRTARRRPANLHAAPALSRGLSRTRRRHRRHGRRHEPPSPRRGIQTAPGRSAST